MQILYLIKSKVLQRFFNRGIKKYFQEKYLEDNTSLSEFSGKLQILFTDLNGTSLFIDEVNEECELEDSYAILAKEKIKSIHAGENIFDLYDYDEDEDIEIKNNFYRFHRFSHLISSLAIESDYSASMILNWINQENINSPLANNSFNTALRVYNWLRMLNDSLSYKNINEEDWIKIKRSILAQLSFVANNLEKHIPGNHILIQLYIIFVGIKIFPEWKYGKQIKTHIDQMFGREILKQFLEDGLHFELSFHYHIQICQFSLFWLIACLKLKESISNLLILRLCKAATIIDSFCMTKNDFAMIGDNCYTFVHSSLRGDVLNIIRLRNQINCYCSEKQLSKNFSIVDNKYIITEIEQSKLIIDIGEFGYSANPGHAHSDTLSFIYFDTVPIFIDPGTRKYSNSPEDLMLKKSLSHNTVEVDGRDQAYLWKFFRWAFLPKVIDVSVTRNDKDIVIKAGYDLSKLVKGIYHIRTFYQTKNKIEITDEIIGTDTHDISLNLVLSPFLHPHEIYDTIILSFNEMKWALRLSSQSKFVQSINKFKVYPSYNFSLDSHKISYNFVKIKLPLKSQLVLERMD